MAERARPMSSPGLFESIDRELRDAEEQLREVVQIRVTPLALPGSVLLMPMSPERARVLGRLHMVRDRGVISDPKNERMMEVLMHPEDWAELLTEVDHHHLHAHDLGEPRSIYGIPVVVEGRGVTL